MSIMLADVMADDTVEAMVAGFFGDLTKAKQWMRTPNPMLGGIAPKDMIAMGNTPWLAKWVQQQISDGGLAK